MTAVADIYSTKERKWKAMTVMLDSGSQRSFITETAAKRLCLIPIASERLSLVLFGNNKSPPQSHDIYRLKIKDRDNGITHVDIMNMPSQLTKPYPSVQLDRDDDRHLKRAHMHIHQHLATPTITPDILLGIDQLWTLLQPSSILQLPSGLTAMSSKLGTVISGKQRHSQSHQRVNAVTVTVNTMNTADSPTDQYDSLEILGIHDSEHREDEKGET